MDDDGTVKVRSLIHFCFRQNLCLILENLGGIIWCIVHLMLFFTKGTSRVKFSGYFGGYITSFTWYYVGNQSMNPYFIYFYILLNKGHA